ncbi:glycosyl hydrolase [Nannochloropsis oceanica]
MRRNLSLLALGITLTFTAAQPTLTLTSIKAVESTRDNKDQWNIKGYFNDPQGDFISSIAVDGVSAILAEGRNEIVSDVTFDAADCRELNNDRGVFCKDTGARISLTRTKRVPKEAMDVAKHSKNKTSSASSYYKVSGVFRRQQFQNSISMSGSLTATIGNRGGSDEAMLSNCNEKRGARTTKLLCK